MATAVERLIERIEHAAKAIREQGRVPEAIRMNSRTIRLVIWYKFGVNTKITFDQLTILDFHVEASETIPDLDFGWRMGHPDRIGPARRRK